MLFAAVIVVTLLGITSFDNDIRASLEQMFNGLAGIMSTPAPGAISAIPPSTNCEAANGVCGSAAGFCSPASFCYSGNYMSAPDCFSGLLCCCPP